MKKTPTGYKRSEIGMIPDDWQVRAASEICLKIQDGTHFSPSLEGDDYLYVTSRNIGFGVLDVSSAARISESEHRQIYSRCDVRRDDLLLTKDGANTGNAALNNLDEELSLLSSVAFLRFEPAQHDAAFYLQYVLSPSGQSQIKSLMAGNAITRLTLQKIRRLRFPVPPLPEQRAIAEVLSDVDALIAALDSLIAKKRAIKQGAMQELLTGKTRLPGFSGEWDTRPLEQVTDCLDTLRIPLNESQRAAMQGPYPYCGANGVLDHVNDYVIDDDIILLAEDGGYFDEYATRPIAYRMSGKCWVNNHAHILKAKPGTNQDFVFYSLVHKNILPFLANGTRAKLNKQQMYRIPVWLPLHEEEQRAIAAVLSGMDAEIEALECRRDKTKALKQGMMQELLTGKTRVSVGAAV